MITAMKGLPPLVVILAGRVNIPVNKSVHGENIYDLPFYKKTVFL